MCPPVWQTFSYNGEAVPVPDAVAPLFKGFKLGGHSLTHNVVYGPLTRCRTYGTVPTAGMATYYSQRASAGGFMLTEATPVSETGHGYPCTPGLHTAAQAEAWRAVTSAVHAKGAVIYCQLWHVGRASHGEYQPGGAAPVAPSAIAITDPAWTVYGPSGRCAPPRARAASTRSRAHSGPHPYPVPRALETGELAAIVADYVSAAKAALAAGFDGVEVHAGNGYLIQQFLSDGTNSRADAYGGSIENRCRFCLDVTAAVVAAVGPARVGIRLAPFNFFLACTDSEPEALYSYLIPQLSAIKLAYVHLIMPRQFEAGTEEDGAKLGKLRKLFDGPALLAGGFDAASGAAALAAGACEAVVYGRHFLSNPDLPKRFLAGAPLNAYDRDTFYSPQHPIKGFSDYPFMGQTAVEGVEAVDPYAVAV